ncbi:MAG: PucR family transcriptional regulator [Lachnospiraceae bacterium]
MEVELADLLQEFPDTGMKLIAGKEGLSRRVSWVHVTETLYMADFLKGGELIFATGVGIHSGEDFLTFLGALSSHHAAGLCIDTGAYMPGIPQKVLDYCNDRSFPLFLLPREVSFESLIRPMSQYLIEAGLQSSTVSAALRTAILAPARIESCLSLLAGSGFDKEGDYEVFVLSAEGFSRAPEQERLLRAAGHALRSAFRPYSVFPMEGRLAVVLGVSDSVPDAAKQAGALLQDGTAPLHSSAPLCLGAGPRVHGIGRLYESFRRALAVCRLQEKGILPAGHYLQRDLGVYRLLLEIPEEGPLRAFCEDTLGPLFAYDREKHSQLAPVLRRYLEENGSVTRTAAAFFVHRNTISYELGRAGEILGQDLSRLDTRVVLLLAFYAGDLLSGT